MNNVDLHQDTIDFIQQAVGGFGSHHNHLSFAINVPKKQADALSITYEKAFVLQSRDENGDVEFEVELSYEDCVDDQYALISVNDNSDENQIPIWVNLHHAPFDTSVMYDGITELPPSVQTGVLKAEGFMSRDLNRIVVVSSPDTDCVYVFENLGLTVVIIKSEDVDANTPEFVATSAQMLWHNPASTVGGDLRVALEHLLRDVHEDEAIKSPMTVNAALAVLSMVGANATTTYH